MNLTKLLKDMGRLVCQMNKLFPNPPVYDDKRRRDSIDKIVLLYSNGQISLHRKKYILTEEIERRKKRLASYNFKR